jgi:protein O-mannosyl-transferase
VAVQKKYKKKKIVPPVVETQQPVTQFHKKPVSKLLLAGIISIFSFLLYANTLGHNYTVDDVTVITSNKIVQKGVDGIGEIFTTPYRKGYWDRNENMYRPVSLVMFALEWEMAPNKPWPGHLMNVLLYSLTGFLIFYTLAGLLVNNTNHLAIAFASALLFAAHPIHTEVVANIKSRDEILSLLFCILSVFSFIKYFDFNKIGWLILSVFSFTLALFSKENAITFLVIFPFAVYFFRNISIKRNIVFSSLFIIPVVIYFIVRYSVLNHLGAHEQVMLINNSLAGAPGFASQLATAVLILGKYILLLVFPHPLVADYSYNQIPVSGWSNPMVLLSAVVILILTFIALKGLKNKSVYSFSIIYFFATISIVSNILFLIEATMGERFLYMPSLAFCFALGYFLIRIFSSKKKENSGLIKLHTPKYSTLVLAVLILIYSIKTYSRNFDWKDNFTLLETDIKNAVNSAREQYAYGSALFVERAMTEDNEQLKQNYLDRSIHHLERSVTIWNAYADAYYMLGKVYLEKGLPQNALHSFHLAAANKNFNTAAFNQDYALAYGNLGDASKAIEYLEKALTLEPGSAETYSNLGLYYTDLKQFDKAVNSLQTAINLKPDFAKAHYNLGLAYAMSGQFQLAINPFQKAIELNSDYTDAYNNLGNTYSALGEYNEALKAYEKVLQLQPNHTKALQNIGITYKILGDEEKSAFYMNKAASLN